MSDPSGTMKRKGGGTVYFAVTCPWGTPYFGGQVITLLRDIADGITDPGHLAIKLYSRDLIGKDPRTEGQKPAIICRVSED